MPFIDEDFVLVRRQADSKSKRLATLAFGDRVEILGEEGNFTKVRLLDLFDGQATGFIKGEPRVRNDGILKFSMVDVQQGDGLIFETPAGKTVFVDSGDNKLFARHAAARFFHRQTSADNPLEVDAIIVTHGDADHFDGLNDLRRCETESGLVDRKRLFIHPRRVFHSGLVKRPGKDGNGKRFKDAEMFGRTVEEGDDLLAIDLYEDPRQAGEAMANTPFRRWFKTLDHWQTRGPIEFHRVDAGMDADDLFDFLAEEDIGIELQGPFATEATDPDSGEQVPALPFFHRPKKSPEMHLEQGAGGGGSVSASHTINGHSIACRLSYGNVRFSLTGDLNQESMSLMLANLSPIQLEAEIVKAPHHGSADFDFRALQAMRPVVAIVSSGDESTQKEHIHPRATLMAALGKTMRGETGVVLVTELAAFFKVKDYSHTRSDLAAYFKERKDQSFTGEELRKLFTGKPRPEDPKALYFGFERTNFGIIHIRTDGERVLTFTHSGKAGLNEAYRFRVTMLGSARQVSFEEVETR